MKPTPLTKQALNEVILRMPFNRLLDFRVSRVYKDGLTLELEFGETMANVLGTLHGGVTATLVDASIGMAVIGSQGGRPATTVELSVNYLRPHSSGKVRARARLLKVGRTLAFGVAEVKDEHGHLIASGSATYMLL